MRAIIAGMSLAALAGPAAADVTGGRWTTGYRMGIAWFSVGTSGGAGWLSLQCTQATRTASILTEIGRQKPVARSALTLTTAGRGGSRVHRFATDAQGDAAVRATSPAFLALWNDLRRGSSVTVRYADGRSWTSSIAGVGTALTPGGCVD